MRNNSSQVHVTHKTIEPFCWWNILDLAEKNELKYIGSIIFDRCNYPGYTNRKVLHKKSFPCNDALTYVFTSNRKHNKNLPNNNYTNEIFINSSLI